MGTLYVNKLIPTSGGDVEVEGDVSGSGKTSIGQSLLVQDDANITGSLTVAGSITGGTFAHISGSSAAFGQSILIQDDVSTSGSIFVGENILPAVDTASNLGASDKRWANIYTNDLHLQNERGDWTIIEEEHELTIRNNKTNKMYKFVLEEIED